MSSTTINSACSRSLHRHRINHDHSTKSSSKASAKKTNKHLDDAKQLGFAEKSARKASKGAANNAPLQSTISKATQRQQPTSSPSVHEREVMNDARAALRNARNIKDISLTKEVLTGIGAATSGVVDAAYEGGKKLLGLAPDAHPLDNLGRQGGHMLGEDYIKLDKFRDQRKNLQAEVNAYENAGRQIREMKASGADPQQLASMEQFRNTLLHRIEAHSRGLNDSAAILERHQQLRQKDENKAIGNTANMVMGVAFGKTVKNGAAVAQFSVGEATRKIAEELTSH